MGVVCAVDTAGKALEWVWVSVGYLSAAFASCDGVLGIIHLLVFFSMTQAGRPGGSVDKSEFL